jgi:hypothetical protein
MPVRMYIGCRKKLRINTTYKTALPRVKRAGTPLTKGLKRQSTVNVSIYWRKHARAIEELIQQYLEERIRFVIVGFLLDWKR